MRHNIFAHTDSGILYPQFLSINLEEDNRISITARSAAWGDGTCGDTATVILTYAELHKLAQTLFSFACTGKA